MPTPGDGVGDKDFYHVDCGCETEEAEGLPATVHHGDVVVYHYVAISSPTVTKAANKATAQVGDVITYTITVENTGNVALHNVADSGSFTNCKDEALAPGETAMIRYSYAVTQADAEASFATNTVGSSPPWPCDSLHTRTRTSATAVLAT